MIIDKIENRELYRFGPSWQRAFEFIKSVTIDSEQKKYQIQGDEIFGIVAGYRTHLRENAVLESHRKYVDIQTLLRGSETIGCFFRDELTIDSPYDESKDAEFYKTDRSAATRFNLRPGSFITLFPHDAHMPGLAIEENVESVIKVVVKVKVELLTAK